MTLTDDTFINMIATLKRTYINWELPDTSVDTWMNVLALSVSDELLPKIILDWISNKTMPPKSPAELIKHGRDMVTKEYGNADSETELLIESSRKAYYAAEDFLSFADDYDKSFASMISGKPAQEAYIIDSIKEHSSNPKVLILVYDEIKGDLKDCFTGDAEHGIEFLRSQIKKKWNEKSTDAARAYLMSGSTGFLEA